MVQAILRPVPLDTVHGCSKQYFILKELWESFIKGKLFWFIFHQSVLHASNNIRITCVNSSPCAYSVVFCTYCATVVIDTSFSQYGIVFYFRFSSKLGNWLVRTVFRTYRSTYFPLFLTNWSLELMDTRDFSSCKEAAIIFQP